MTYQMQSGLREYAQATMNLGKIGWLPPVGIEGHRFIVAPPDDGIEVDG
jgi:hypothetical protein